MFARLQAILKPGWAQTSLAMLRTQQPVKILSSGNNFEIKDFQNRIKSQNRWWIANRGKSIQISKLYSQDWVKGPAQGSNQSILWFAWRTVAGEYRCCSQNLKGMFQVRYQYRSPQKVQGELQMENQQGRRGAGTLQEGSTRGSRVSSGTSRGLRGAKGRPKERQLEATSDYGTMSRWFGK